MPSPPPEMQKRVRVLTDIARSAAEDGKTMFFVRIPGDIKPLERGDAFEDRLDEALKSAEVGGVTGGGSQLGEGNSVVYCGIDVEVGERKRGLEVIRTTMRDLGAPPGTTIEEFLPEWREHSLESDAA
jgi:hypothetical protein